jgi:hypothetical protein
LVGELLVHAEEGNPEQCGMGQHAGAQLRAPVGRGGYWPRPVEAVRGGAGKYPFPKDAKFRQMDI